MITERSLEKEWIDLGPAYYSDAEYTDCLRILFTINRLLGIFRDTRRLLSRLSFASLIDVGCGGGLFLIHLGSYFPKSSFLGIDVNTQAISNANIALQQHPQPNVRFEAQANPKIPKADIILATLVCHHMSDEELIDFLKEAYHQSQTAVILHDLHRHPLPIFFYRLVSPIFRNRIISHDGLISIRRGFTRHEWKQLLTKANLTAEISWRFPFRWRIVIWKTS